MPGITGQATTYNLPNYVGDLFGITPTTTPFLSAIGGLTGGRSTGATFFEWQTYDLRDADANRQRLEGADAPEAEARTRVTNRNVLEIHQESVEVSYTRQAIRNQASVPTGATTVTVGNTAVPVDEMQWQIDKMLTQVAFDVEKSFLTGTMQVPTDNQTPRKTGGLIPAITTNVSTVSGGGGLTETAVLDLFQKVWENGGIQIDETRTVIVNATLKRALTKIFITDKNYRESTRNVGGVNLTTFETDFGSANIMLDRFMPADTLVVASLDEMAPRFLEIPGKGHFFLEPLAKTGASDKVQLYGEIGLEWGIERHHGKITVS